MKFAVAVFPGTNCDRETLHVLRDVFGQTADPVWHEDTDLAAYDCVVLPGGFAHGDHLRAGAIARFSPIMRAVERFARGDRLVWGICNGFQVLLEAGLLPGAMLPNAGRAFVCSWVYCRVESATTPFTARITPGQVLRLPIAHGEGRYYAPPETLRSIERRGQVALRYCLLDGRIADAANPNGALANVAGLCNEGGNVFALMPHPERASEPELASQDGRALFESLLAAAGERPLLSPPTRDAIVGAHGVRPSSQEWARRAPLQPIMRDPTA
ncbi:MAG: phosphoribosylformylglycinamidine synthase subunit PurQ [Chloroflexi bacterium]|nr:phosphoribosylformylglycinamidine synthase subunit PurQ [Chloroflexota bacterium]